MSNNTLGFKMTTASALLGLQSHKITMINSLNEYLEHINYNFVHSIFIFDLLNNYF